MTTTTYKDTTTAQALMFVFAEEYVEFDEQERDSSPFEDEQVDWSAWWAEYAELMD